MKAQVVMSEFRADLHCHSTCSDGSLSPRELVQHAKQIGLSGLSITDHDSAAAYSDAIPAAKELGLELITGIEFSAVWQNQSVHVLAYSFRADHPLLLDFCNRHQLRRKERNQAILSKLAEHGMPITQEDLHAFTDDDQSGHVIGRPHIALAMLKKGYVTTLQEAFKSFLAEDKPCYVRGESFTVEETIDLIHKINGLAIIAHPHLIKNQQLTQSLLSMPFDGLEGYYAMLSPEQNHRWVKVAKARNWIITGGSDFHGDIKPNIALGCSWVRDDTFELLKEHYLRNLAQT